MGYCGTRIPGHTGTDFKHKKVFQNKKKIVNKQRRFANTKIEARETKQSNSKITVLFKLVTLISILMLVTSISLLSFHFTTVSIQKYNLSNEYFRSLEAQEKKETAEMLYKSANSHFKAGNLDYAQGEIVLFLKLFPRSVDGLTLMREILEKQCEVNNLYCQEAKEYQDYLCNTRTIYSK